MTPCGYRPRLQASSGTSTGLPASASGRWRSKSATARCFDLPRVSAQVEPDGFEWLEIKSEHLLAVATLPSFADHKDPFDRLLVAQSLTEPLTLLTVDKTLARYGATVRLV